MPNVKHGLSGTREYQREKLREWRQAQSGVGKQVCECSRPATMLYEGDRVCVVCYSRQKKRDHLVDAKELLTKRHEAWLIRARGVRAKYLEVFGIPATRGWRKK